MTSEATADPLERIRTKFEQLKAAEAEYNFGVVLVDGAALEPFPGIPRAAFEVFGIIGRIEGSHFRFAQPPELSSVAAFQALPDNPNDPLGPALSIGQELHSVPKHLRGEIDGGKGISYDLEDGDVYHIDPDDYLFLYEHPDEDVNLHIFAPDIITFFDEFVLGDKYPQVVDTILGPGVRQQRVREGRFQGQYADTWLRLLVAAGLAS